MPPKSKRPAARTASSGPISKPAPLAQTPMQTRADKPAAGPQQDSNFLTNAQSEAEYKTGDTTEDASEITNATNINRKKQKRRDKEVARRLAQQSSDLEPNGHLEDETYLNDPQGIGRQGRGPVKGYFTEETEYIQSRYQDRIPEDDEFFSDEIEEGDYAHEYAQGAGRSWLNTSKRKKGSKKRSRPPPPPPPNAMPHNVVNPSRSSFPTLSNAALRSAQKMSHSSDHIWNTSTQAERENIKQFWLDLGEDERRSLVRVEKEAVLRKMKEQQKHSCSCSVCGRKRTAIEEELEVLYDAYYQELEQFANHDGTESPRTMVPPLPPPPPPPRTPIAYRNPAHPMAGAYPVQGRIHELGEDGEELDDEDEYDDEEDDDEPYSDEDYDDDLPPGPTDFFQFGNSLTVKDGILTVADDLLKNDGKHFIDMMEQLAERRMQREEEIHYPVPPLAHQSSRQGHNHPPLDDEDDYDDEEEEEDDEDYDSQEEEDFDGDEMDSMTEEQRMEEGRRMFQIFAARMFEQRVLTAYKEKVAAERQQRLLEELDEENKLDTQREAKKAKDAAKKKEKKARQKAAQAEEKAKKDAEKAAAEAAAKAAEEAKLAEKRAKQEEQRKKREAERKAAEEERLKKEAEKVQRAQKERERQQEAERKAREAKEKEKKLREEQRKKEREEREQREVEAREKKQKEEQERRDRDLQQRKIRDQAARAERDARDRVKAEQAIRPQPIVLPPGLHPPGKTSQLTSPSLAAASPATSTHMSMNTRTRQISQPSQSSSPPSQKAGTDASQASPASPPNPITAQPPFIQPSKHPRQAAAPLHHPQPSMPRSPLPNMGRAGHYSYNPAANIHAMGMNGLAINGPGNAQNGLPQMHNMYPGPPLMAAHQRYPPNGINYPPGFNTSRPSYQAHQQLPFHPMPPPPLNSSAPYTQPPLGKLPAHSRQASGSDIVPQPVSQPAPIARPGPIARPSSVTPDKPRASEGDVEKITTQLGSSALLDDSDEPFAGQLDSRPQMPLIGAPGTGRLPFASTFNNERQTGFGLGSPSWNSFGNNSNSPNGSWKAGPRIASSWSPQPFDPMGPQSARLQPARPVAVRLWLVHACRRLNQSPGKSNDGYYPAQELLQLVQQIKPPTEQDVSPQEFDAICDTEGNVQNGGGVFDVIRDDRGAQLVKFVEEKPAVGARGGVGDIGSPVMASSQQVSSFGSIGQGVVGSQHSHHAGFGPPGPPGPAGGRSF